MEAGFVLDTIIELNVGGRVFATTRSTLNRCDCMFSRMFESSVGVKRDPKGRVFIDRSGELFVFVLEYLRTGQLLSMPEQLRKAVEEEMRFFCITMEEVDTDVSDADLQAMVAAARQHKLDEINPVLLLPETSQRMAELVVGDLLRMAHKGTLRTGHGNIVFICGTASAKLVDWALLQKLPLPAMAESEEALQRGTDEAISLVLAGEREALPAEVKHFFARLPRLTKSNDDEQTEIVFEVVRGVKPETFHVLCENLKRYLQTEKKLTLHLSLVNKQATKNYEMLGYLKTSKDLIKKLLYARFTWNFW
jgi:hypothetical protein